MGIMLSLLDSYTTLSLLESPNLSPSGGEHQHFRLGATSWVYCRSKLSRVELPVLVKKIRSRQCSVRGVASRIPRKEQNSIPPLSCIAMPACSSPGLEFSREMRSEGSSFECYSLPSQIWVQQHEATGTWEDKTKQSPIEVGAGWACRWGVGKTGTCSKASQKLQCLSVCL